jgi:hypothetical protein
MRDVWKQAPRGTVRRIDRFESRHDTLWTSMARHVTCAVRRDASYMNWKYVEQPGQDFIRLELLDAQGMRGVVVCMVREPDDAYRYRRGFIVDLVAPLGDAQLLHQLLQAAIDALSERDVDAVWCLHVNPLLTAALRHAGFRFREPTRFLLVRPGQLDADLAGHLLRADAWFVTQGDSDIDRP